MSTAGKVLVVIIMLVSIACLMLASAVVQINYAGNRMLDQIAKDLAKAQEDLEATRFETIQVRDKTILVQEKIDRDLTTLRAQQADLVRSRSQLVDMLERLKYDLDAENRKIELARAALQTRNSEFDADEKSLDDLRRKVQGLKASTGQQTERLQSLRSQFQQNYRSSREMLGKYRAE
jgi:chromosome segregation ATPase